MFLNKSGEKETGMLWLQVALAQWWLGSGVVRRDGIKKQKRKGAHDNKKTY